MVFSSTLFLFYFLPVVLLLYYLTSKNTKASNTVLLASSLLFYLFGGIDTFPLIIVSIIINYLVGFLIGLISNQFMKKYVLLLGVICNTSLLFYYKYFNFFIKVYNMVPRAYLKWMPNAQYKDIVLPIGISFFTFQGMSYIIDVYRGEVFAQRNVLKVALYISLFPQLIAGPIVRYSDINKQLSTRIICIDRITEGTFRFIFGLGKKCILADVMSEIADKVFAMNPGSLTPSLAWAGAISYTLQIYFDFSGYSDMAIGMGKMLGFDFPENFNYPYTSKSIREFWRRWHISLSAWFRDYVYIPLGGSRRGNVYFNLLVIFLLTGLWHGADFVFLFWGMWHGFFCIVERFVASHFRIRLPSLVSRLYTLLIVTIGWVMFRSEGIVYAIKYIFAMFGKKGSEFNYYNVYYFLDRRYITSFVLALALAFGIPQFIYNRADEIIKPKIISALRYPYALFILVLSLMMVINRNYSPFIYFRF